MNLLLSLIVITPLANCLLLRFAADFPPLLNFFNKFFPLLFLAFLIGIYGNYDQSGVVLIKAAESIELGFEVKKFSLGFLFLLNFFWLIFTFYTERFFHLNREKNSHELKIFFTFIIACLTLLISSKNLITTLFFYNVLLFLCHFFALKFFYEKETKFSHFFTFLLYLESFFFFLAIVATHKFSGSTEFIDGGILSQKFDKNTYSLIFVLYFSALFFSVLLPFYLLYNRVKSDPIAIYILFFFAYGFSSFYIFVKLLNSVFGFQTFSQIISEIGFGFFEWIFLVNIIVASITIVIRPSFLYLFFQQFLFALLTIFIFANFAENRIYLPLMSFFLSLTLIFLCLTNFVLYLKNSENKRSEGLFYSLRINSLLLIFAVLNLLGVAPAVGLIEKFFLLKIIIEKKLLLSALAFLVNFCGLIGFSYKVIYPLFIRLDSAKQTAKEKTNSALDLELARNIDFDSSLILTALIVAIAIFLLLFLPIIL